MVTFQSYNEKLIEIKWELTWVVVAIDAVHLAGASKMPSYNKKK